MRIAIYQASLQGFFPRFYTFLYNAAIKNGDDMSLFCPMSSTNNSCNLPNKHTYGSKLNWYIHYHIYKWIGLQDIFSLFSTFQLIHQLKNFKPDVINLHMSNSWTLNFPLFVKYVNKHQIPVIWTMHDCRAFTGRCAHFEDAGCDKWKIGCGKCPLKSYYWPTKIDNSALQWQLRKNFLYKFNDLTIITPSKWLLNYVQQSPIVASFNSICIYNGVDIAKFASPQKSNLRLKYNLQHKKIILGIAMQMDRLKGLDFFIQLARDLTEEYCIVLVGGVNQTDLAKIPRNIILLPRTSSTEELIGIYQTVDVFVNPTLIDNFPTTNIEALASGTPVVTFRTGGSAESIDETSGIAVSKNDYDGLRQAIIYVLNHKQDIYRKDKCIKRAENFSLQQFNKYIELYHSKLA